MGGGSTGVRTVYSTHAGKGSYNNTIEDYEEKPKVFLSFSMRNKIQADLFRYQAEDDKYSLEFEDTSLKYPIENVNWHGPVGTKIEQSDVVIVFIGEDTHKRPAVNWEIRTAYQNDIPVIPVRVQKDRRFRLPSAIKRNGDYTVQWKLNEIQHRIEEVTKEKNS